MDQLREGKPLLGFDSLSLDWPLVQELFAGVTRAITAHEIYDSREVAGLLSLAANTPVLQQAVKAWYESLPLSPIAAAQGVSEEFLATAIQVALQPFLIAHSEMWSGLVIHELWRHRHCPLCGGKPDFAFLDKERGARWLLCSRCDAQWLFQRLECPYCGTHNMGSLAYFADDAGLYRLYTCDECHSYIKAIDLRHADAKVILPLERLITVEMDRQAEEAGYKVAWTKVDLFSQLYKNEYQKSQHTRQ